VIAAVDAATATDEGREDSGRRAGGRNSRRGACFIALTGRAPGHGRGRIPAPPTSRGAGVVARPCGGFRPRAARWCSGAPRGGDPRGGRSPEPRARGGARTRPTGLPEPPRDTQGRLGTASAVQRGSAGSYRRSGLAVWSGSQIGTKCHHPSPTGTGRYSVVQPHQLGMWTVWGGRHPCGRRCSARTRIGTTSRPQVQQARVGRRRPAASSQMGGVTGSLRPPARAQTAGS
jgi:hypothetical protein